jgi:4-deoxy-L-threo-5-hexosulose-uronate ketol-isomerase
MPLATPLAFGPEHANLVGTDDLLERRELGVVNVGGAGVVRAAGETYELGAEDALYIGLGTMDVSFESADAGEPAKFYVNSTPAHAAFPTKLIRKSDAILNELGAVETANVRKLRQYLHPKVLPTCQLLMGITRLESGSVWNTMPPHTHDRRMEAYLYFDLPEDGFVLHLMGRPSATRHLLMRDGQVALSPPWSVHCGAGTGAYAFVWSMAGDNQAFTDMDMVPMGALK